MEYTMLTGGDFEGLRRERIASLEAEHYRLGLLLLETTSADAAGEILARQADYERRITLHAPAPKEAAEELAAVESTVERP